MEMTGCKTAVIIFFSTGFFSLNFFYGNEWISEICIFLSSIHCIFFPRALQLFLWTLVLYIYLISCKHKVFNFLSLDIVDIVLIKLDIILIKFHETLFYFDKKKNLFHHIVTYIILFCKIHIT